MYVLAMHRVARSKALVATHHGLRLIIDEPVDGDIYIEFQPREDGSGLGRLQQVSKDEFAAGQTVRELGEVADLAGATTRLRELEAGEWEYSLVGNNCEHVAEYVATGKRRSFQVRSAATVVGLAALWWFLREE